MADPLDSIPLFDLVVQTWPHAARDFPPFAKGEWERVEKQVPRHWWLGWVRDRYSSSKFCPKPNELLNAHRESREGGTFRETRESESAKWARWRAESDHDTQWTMGAWLTDHTDETLEALRDNFASMGSFARSRVSVKDGGDTRPMTAAEIRDNPFLACLLRGHEANTKEAV